MNDPWITPVPEPLQDALRLLGLGKSHREIRAFLRSRYPTLDPLAVDGYILQAAAARRNAAKFPMPKGRITGDVNRHRRRRRG